MNGYHIEDHYVFNESNTDADYEFDVEDNHEDDDSDDDVINEEVPGNFRNSFKVYFIMKSRVPIQEDMPNLLEDRNNHHQLSETTISLIDLVYLLTKQKVD